MGERVTFGGWLKQRRTQMGRAQEELAEHIGCSPIMLRKLEAGERRPSRQIAFLLAGYFHIPSDEREAFVTFARTGRSLADLPKGEAAHTHAPWRTAHLRQAHLPAMLTPLVGREYIEGVACGLLQSRVRLLTLTGPPGVGKTRLALQVASDLVEHFEDGAYFVDLSLVYDPDKVPAAIARALGVAEAGERGIEDVLLSYVSDKRLLLLLDNFEQVLDAGVYLVALMQASPWLKVVVTSREALHVRGEHRLPVPPLDLPDLRKMPALEELGHYPSVELFVERAQAVSPDFTLTEDNAEEVAAVCIGLEGLPLAIELATARADMLSPKEMRAALDTRLKLLTGGGRDLPRRQRTLGNAVAWSYDLLSPKERTVCSCLGVFVGGFSLEAARSVCGTGSSEPDVTQTVQALLEKNLLRWAEEPVEGQERRFTMLETIREYALGRLRESGRLEAVERSHVNYYLTLAEAIDEALEERTDAALVDRLEREHGNLWAAMQRAEEHGEGEWLLRLAGALFHFWEHRGYWSEAREWLGRALAEPQGAGRTAARARALRALGVFAFLKNDPEHLRYHEESAEIYRDLGDKGNAAKVLMRLAMMRSYFTAQRGEVDPAAARLLEECLAIYKELGDRRSAASALNRLGVLFNGGGKYCTASTYFEEALTIARDLGDKAAIASVLGNLGEVAHCQADYAGARSFYGESLALFRSINARSGIATMACNLAFTLQHAGECAEAAAQFRECLLLGQELGEYRCTSALTGMAGLAIDNGQLIDAVRLLGAVDAAQVAAPAARLEPSTRMEFGASLATTRDALDEDVFQGAWQEGQAMSMEEAIQYAWASFSGK